MNKLLANQIQLQLRTTEGYTLYAYVRRLLISFKKDFIKKYREEGSYNEFLPKSNSGSIKLSILVSNEDSQDWIGVVYFKIVQPNGEGKILISGRGLIMRKTVTGRLSDLATLDIEIETTGVVTIEQQ